MSSPEMEGIRAEYARAVDGERQERLDDVLSAWHHWQIDRSARVGRGFSNSSPVVGEFHLTSRQYDDQNGALYEDEEDERMGIVQAQVNEMDDPYRSAVYVMARAIYLGVRVFHSPRLPERADVRDLVIATARVQLILRLTKACVL